LDLLALLRRLVFSTLEGFTIKPKSLVGQELLLQHFPGGQNQPTSIIVAEDKSDALIAAVSKVKGVASVAPEILDPKNPVVKEVGGKVVINATLAVPADSSAARELIPAIREAAHNVDSASLVGGISANLPRRRRCIKA
jgi:RND superfamily putative drug exporter